nr:CHAP domain-containing protein [uncultured Agathobaculum sp.]
MAYGYVDEHRLYLERSGEAARDITAFVGDLTATDDITALSVELTGTQLVSQWDKYVPKLALQPGDKLRLRNEAADADVFVGQLVTVGLDGALTAYDRGWYLGRSGIILQCSGMAADEAIRAACGKAGVGVKSVTSLPTKISEVWLGDAVSDIIAEILERCTAETGKEYQSRMSPEGLVVRELPTTAIKAYHKPAWNLAPFDITWALGQVSGEDSIAELYNAVVIAAEDNGKVYRGAQASNAASIERYGFLQYIESVSENPGTAQLGQMVRTLLAQKDRVGRTRTVSEIWGCDEVTSGTVLDFNSPAFGISGRNRVTRVVHHYGGAGHTMELEITALDEPRAAAAGTTDAARQAAAQQDAVSVWGLPDTIGAGSSGTGGNGSASSFVAVARGEIGYHESPGNINKYGAWAGNNGAAWCVYFVCWCADQSGAPIPTGYGGVSEMRSYFQSRGRYKTVANGYIPQAGDLMIQGTRHIGIVTSATRASVQTIEGNCSDSVRAMTRYYSEITGFCTPWG